MMRTTAKHPDITPMPVPLAETEFNDFIFPHLSRPKRGPKCQIGYHRLLNLIVWVLYTGMPWKCLPMAKDPPGKPAIHDTNVYRAFATWADDGSRQQAFMASGEHLADETTLDLHVLPGDGTNTVAKKGAMGLATQATNPSRARQSSRSRTTMAMSWLPCRLLPSMRRT